jgi:hypothetical protein
MKQKKRNDGKKLEQVVRLIHETLKESSNTQVYANHKIENIDGQKREFDVFITAIVNEINISIAIECKAYTHPISVTLIEAFESKCQGVPSINKKIFVTESKYQIGAIKAAARFGIELYEMRTLKPDVIQNWIPSIKQLKLIFQIQNSTVYLDTSKEEFEQIAGKLPQHFYINTKDTVEIPIRGFLDEYVKKNSKKLWSIALQVFMGEDGKEGIGKTYNTTLRIAMENSVHAKVEQRIYYIIGIEASINFWLEEKDPTDINIQSLQRDSKVQANVISIGMEKSYADFIITDKKVKIFNRKDDGTSQELQHLLTYDPISKTIKPNQEGTSTP